MVFFLPIIIAISILIFYQIHAKNKQREHLIEKGINPDGISIIEYQKLTNLTNGVLLISISLGLSFAYFLREFFDLEEFLTVYLSSLLFFGGLGYIANYLIYKRR